ncbi:MAG TPA: hypothetical protein DCQ28_09050 [Bacteroidetes bacterium]|nr:hypothetical protein [Bacteroidota bacterium]
MVRSYTKQVLLLALLTVIISATMIGQSKVGTDIYSRYIWRGTDYGNSTSVQPALTYAIGDLSVGVWGSYALTGGYSEADIWASYAVGPVTLYFTDYYIPAAPPTLTFFNYGNKGGAHVLEVGAGYTGGESFPISVTGYVNVLNDANNSIYILASYPILSDLGLTVAMTPTKSIYGTTKAGLINVGFTGSKTIKLTETFSIPFNAQYIMNPYAETAFLIFGISL